MNPLLLYVFGSRSYGLREQWNDDTANKPKSSTEKDLLKARSINLKKSKIRHKDRIVGGQNKQGHSSVYE